MIEIRGIIKDIKETRRKVEELGGELRSNYEFKDVIFSEDINNNLKKDFLRLRIYSKNNWPTKDFVLVRKKTEFKEVGKISNKILKKEFDNKKDSINYIKENFPGFKKTIEYSREGWQYQLNKNKIFIENIKEYKPSIEIEAENKKELKTLLKKFDVLKTLKEPLAEIMRRNKK